MGGGPGQVSPIVAVSAPDRTSIRRVRPSRGRRITPYLFLLVPLALLLVLTYVPFAEHVPVQRPELGRPEQDPPFVGLDNYIEFFTRPELFGVFFVSLYYIVGSFIQIGLALYLATILSFKVRFKNLFKGILFFPYLINGVAIALHLPVLLPPRRRARLAPGRPRSHRSAPVAR